MLIFCGSHVQNSIFGFELNATLHSSSALAKPNTKPFKLCLYMDKYDYMILDIIQEYKLNHQSLIRLGVLEENYWKRIQDDESLSVGKARIGERITKLYLDGMIQNKGGYMLTKKGREQLAFAPQSSSKVA